MTIANRFYKHRKEIYVLATVNHISYTTASVILADEYEWENYNAELKEFDEYIATLVDCSTEENNLMAKYFR